MPTPFIFDKSIALFVDDDPCSNYKIASKIMENDETILVLQLLNTKTLEIWMS